MNVHRRSTSYTTHASGLLAKWHQTSPSPLLSQCAPYKKESIEAQVHSTFPWCQIDEIRQIYHPSMYGMYLLRKEEMLVQRSTCDIQELQLYHVTTRSRGIKSLENGLDWRRTRRSKFGRGVSFSDNCDYANFYADFSSDEDTRVIIVCNVLVASKCKIQRNTGMDLDVPPGTADTTVSPNGRVYVKYNDYEFCPLYMVYYRCKREDLRQSRYFTGKNGPRTAATNRRNKLVPLVDTAFQQKEDERSRIQQLLQQQLEHEQIEQRRRQQAEQRRRRQADQQRRQAELQRRHAEQQQKRQYEERIHRNYNRNTNRGSNDNGCLIL